MCLDTAFVRQTEGPCSSYSAFVWHACWNSGIMPRTLPPNQTAKLCVGWVMTLTSTAWAVAGVLASTRRFMSRCTRLPKSLNIVEPPCTAVHTQARPHLGRPVQAALQSSGTSMQAAALRLLLAWAQPYCGMAVTLTKLF